MTTYYVYHGSSSEASPYDTWDKAAHSLQALDTAITLASDDIIYIAADHVDPTTAAANLTLVGPTTGAPVKLISVNRGTGAYERSTTNQVDTSAGAYSILFDNSWAIYGVRAKSGSTISFAVGATECAYTYEMTCAPAANSYVMSNGGSGSGRAVHDKMTVDLTADGTSTRTGAVFSGLYPGFEMRGTDFVNAGYRTGYVFDTATNQTGWIRVSGSDFSVFNNATTCEVLNLTSTVSSSWYVCNCKLTAAQVAAYTQAIMRNQAEACLVNCAVADAPESLSFTQGAFGVINSSATIYRTGGAQVESTACSWLVVTGAYANEGTPFYAPWIYGTVSSTGSKTFTTYITNDTADFDDDEVWLEVECLGTEDSPVWTLATDHRSPITATPAAQADDTTSEWNGAGPAFAYKQALSVTATVGETGQFRARVVVGVASIASSRNFYIDPKVTVS